MSEHNYEDVWKYALEQIKQQFIKSGKETEFKLWFNMNYVEDTISTITVSVASEFLWQSMLKKGNVQLVSKKIEELTGQSNIKIQHIISNQSVFNPDESDSEIVSMSSNSDESESDSIKNQFSEKKSGCSLKFTDSAKTADNKKALKKHPQLFEKYTFDTFIPGSNSDYAYNAAIAASKNPGKTYNPILLYGGVGLGKTHLMEAIGNYIYQERGDSFKICYVPAETFTNEFTSSIKAQTTEKFKSKYRNLDVLLLDDIQFLQGKAQTQEELFHTFNALHDSSSQMVFTCDRPVT